MNIWPFTKFYASYKLICPRCERSMECHDDRDCERRMSRRYFFGVTIGAVALATGVNPLLESITINRIDVLYGSVKVTTGNSFISATQLSREVLEVLKKNLTMTHELFNWYDGRFNEVKVEGIYTV